MSSQEINAPAGTTIRTDDDFGVHTLLVLPAPGWEDALAAIAKGRFSHKAIDFHGTQVAAKEIGGVFYLCVLPSPKWIDRLAEQHAATGDER